MNTGNDGHDKVILELDDNDTDQKAATEDNEKVILDLSDDHFSGADNDGKTDADEDQEDRKTGETDESETSDADQADDSQDLDAKALLGKVIGQRHENRELRDRIAQLETSRKTPEETPELSPAEEWVSQQKPEDQDELTEADIPFKVMQQERAFRAKQAETQAKVRTQQETAEHTQQSVQSRIQEVWQDEDAQILYTMAEKHLDDAQVKNFVGLMANAKDTAEAVEITKRTAIAIIEANGSESQKQRAKVFAPKSKAVAKKKSVKSSQQSQTDDSQGNEDDELDFSMLDGLL